MSDPTRCNKPSTLRINARMAPCGRPAGHDGFCAFEVVKVLTRKPAVHGPEFGWKIGATRLGITVEAYRDHRLAGERWCTIDQQWESEDRFIANPARPGGVSGECFESNRRASREYQRRKWARLRGTDA